MTEHIENPSTDMDEKTNLTIRISKNEKKMIDVLRKKYFINISEYVRASIKHLYESKVKPEIKKNESV